MGWAASLIAFHSYCGVCGGRGGGCCCYRCSFPKPSSRIGDPSLWEKDNRVSCAPRGCLQCLRTLPVIMTGGMLLAPSWPRQGCCKTPHGAQDGPTPESDLVQNASGAEVERPGRVTLSLWTPLLQGCQRACSCPAGLPASELAFQY